jgi:acetamidase/formamidase
MRANRIEYLFSVNAHTPPTMTVDSGEEFTVEVRGAFDDVEDISAVPTSFTPACDGHPLAPIAGPIVVRDAKPGDVVAIDLIELTLLGVGKSHCGLRAGAVNCRRCPFLGRMARSANPAAYAGPTDHPTERSG